MLRGMLQLFGAYGASLLFWLLEGLSLVLLVQNNPQQSEIFWNSWGILTNVVEARMDGMVDYIGIRADLLELQTRNIQLLEEKDNALYSNKAITGSVDGDSILQAFTYIKASVISNSVSINNNYLRLDKGREHGIEPHVMGVIGADGQGIVGVVNATSSHFSQVMSVLHSQSRISASIKGSGYFGVLVWNGIDPELMQLDAVPKHAKVAVGDTVITSGYSQIFPRGIFVGTIEGKPYIKEGDNFYTIQVKLASDLSKIDYVYVTKHEMQDEFRELEKERNE
ncbi:MAG TPA: rod shape-determining protein MreC [Saprospiraceae bacterium]|nr:rod shape-determining protein MreC [Saprospiraceae bacterium]HMQ82384.1 rod shape-determining protein MreC [Saprospiraceae bacterium]